MHLKQTDSGATRKDEAAIPRRCPRCGKREVTMATIHYEAEVRHDGRLHTFSIPDLQVPVCCACGERIFTEQADTQVNAALRAHLRLLTPAQISAGIHRVGGSQKEVCEQLGIAEATLSRWLNESQIQSRAMDNFLRVYLAFPHVRAALGRENQDSQLGMADVPDTALSRRRSKR